MKLLIVDDSALMRQMLQQCFADQPDVETATARDGEDALDRLETFEPDVITLDINMPKMDGLTCLAHIMERRPCPVVMVSSLTERGAMATFEALELGAVDFVAKPDGTVSLHLDQVFDQIRQKVRAAHASNARHKPATPPPASRRRGAAAPRSTFRAMAATAGQDVDLVLIGSSTGGPKALGEVLERLPASFPAPIVIAQHMPARFTRIFAERLQSNCAIRVHELDREMTLEPGAAYIATGSSDVEIGRRFRTISARPVEVDEGFTWHPSVSRLVASALEVIDPARMVGVMLTGMGDDGAAEMAELYHAGGRTIAEAQETCAVFGMPSKLIEREGAGAVLPVDRIADQLIRWMPSASSLRGVS